MHPTPHPTCCILPETPPVASEETPHFCTHRHQETDAFNANAFNDAFDDAFDDAFKAKAPESLVNAPESLVYSTLLHCLVVYYRFFDAHIRTDSYFQRQRGRVCCARLEPVGEPNFMGACVRKDITKMLAWGQRGGVRGGGGGVRCEVAGDER